MVMGRTAAHHATTGWKIANGQIVATVCGT
jgi:hypothetical protein